MRRSAWILAFVLLVLMSSVYGDQNVSQPGTFNISQINGVTPLMGNGLTGTGSLRVTIASDTTSNTNPYAVNQTQMNGVALLGGNGVTGTGSQRVTIASDNSAIAGMGAGAAGSAVPANAEFGGARAATANPTNATGGNLVGLMADKAGRLVVTAWNVRELIGVQRTAVAATAETTIVTAGGAGVFNDISQLIITTAGAAAQTITIKDSTAGTTRLVLDYPNATVAPGSPLVVNFNPPLPQATANANWTATNSLATAVNFTVVFVKNL